MFDFFFKIASKLTADIKRPFKLEGMFRVDDTPVHKAIREALVNTLVNADYYGRQGLVVQKYPDKFVFANPGNFRIPLKDAFDGGTSDPRNASMLKMFSMLDIGERAGSGIPGIVATWEKEFNLMPEYIQSFPPSRTKTVLNVKNLLPSGDKVAISGDKVAINGKSGDKITAKEHILNYINTYGSINNSTAMELTGLSASGVRKIFSQLTAQKIITPEGERKNRIYKLNKVVGESK